MAAIFSSYDLVSKPSEGKENPADIPSRTPNYEIGYENMTAKLLAMLAATTLTESYDDHLPEIITALKADFVATDI